MELNRKAWAILSPDEKTALGTMFGMNKSSWEAGEIMDKSHYKFLEIKYRAQKFLEMFTEYINLYEEIIPDYIKGEVGVINYFRMCIGKRMKPMVAIAELNNNDIDRVYTKSGLNGKIISQLRRWGKSEDVFELAIFNLIKEFDRWNNFRILPREVQEPSAFKRRVKNMYKKHIRVLTSMPELSREKLIELSKTNSKSNYAYMPILINGNYKVLKVKVNKGICPLYNNLALYIFKTKKAAEIYITNVFHYVHKQKKDCKDGIVFWQIYRECIKTAQNYYEVQKITATRTHLEMAYENLTYYGQKY